MSYDTWTYNCFEIAHDADVCRITRPGLRVTVIRGEILHEQEILLASTKVGTMHRTSDFVAMKLSNSTSGVGTTGGKQGLK